MVVTLSSAPAATNTPKPASTPSTAATDALKKAGGQVAVLLLSKAQDAIKAEEQKKKDVIAVPKPAEPAAAAEMTAEAKPAAGDKPAAAKPAAAGDKPADKPAAENKPADKPAAPAKSADNKKPAADKKPSKPASGEFSLGVE
jgi:hypothetical protein